MTTPAPITIDATNQPLGRLASRCAQLLMEKHRVHHRTHHLPAQRVVVRNAARVFIDKRKYTQKRTYRTSGHPGGLQWSTLGERFARSPAAVLQHTVRGMLPNNRLRALRLKNLIVNE